VTDDLVDEPHRYPVLAEALRFDGAKWSIWSETVDIDGHVVVRDVLRHPGAVAVAAVDDAAYLWEIPAGLLDQAGEDPLECARRELLEETGVVAQEWERLMSLALSPGGTSERITIYRATGLTIDPAGRPHTGEAEERELPQRWVTISDAVERCFDGSISNATAVAAILALAARSA
jgi:8-oxo-dGTP pyrophosphatase MutT (NUDIX family)